MEVIQREDGFEEVTQCPLCENQTFKIIKEAIYYLNLLPPISVLRCKNCSLLLLSPRPGLEMRKKLFQGELPEALQAYGRSIAYGPISQSSESLYKKRLMEIEQMVTKKAGEKISALDIGTANGFFIQIAREQGWKIYGIEPSGKQILSNSIKSVQKNIVMGSAERLPFSKESFDVVHAHHVFEHLSDAVLAAREVFSVLKDGGVFCFEVPNPFDNIMFLRDNILKRVPQRTRDMYSIHHLFFFSKKTVALLLEKSGFCSIMIKSFYQWPIFGWKTPFTLLTRVFGTFFYGGSLIRAYGFKSSPKDNCR